MMKPHQLCFNTKSMSGSPDLVGMLSAILSKVAYRDQRHKLKGSRASVCWLS